MKIIDKYNFKKLETYDLISPLALFLIAEKNNPTIFAPYVKTLPQSFILQGFQHPSMEIITNQLESFRKYQFI